MTWVFDDKLPIYLQIIQILKADIARGKYQTGEKLPAVRELALTAGGKSQHHAKGFGRTGAGWAGEKPANLRSLCHR